MERVTRLLRGGTSQSVILTAFGCLALVLWCYWWGASIRKDRLVKGEATWLTPCASLGWDFLANYQAVRAYKQGVNPYVEDYQDPAGMPYCYAPVLLHIFGWCDFVGRRKAVVIWMGALTFMATAGAIASWRSRQQLGLAHLPLIFVLAATLCSLPVVYALERGNCDLLVLVLLLGMGRGLQGKSIRHDLAVGCCLALATWIKVYPGLLGLVLIALWRPRAIVLTALVWAAIGLSDWENLKLYWHNLRWYTGQYEATFFHTVHTLTSNWKYFWIGTRLDRLVEVPGVVATSVLILPWMMWLSYRMFRCPNRNAVLYPYLVWMMAAATYFPPISNDYNLFFLPLAALATWDRRDPVWVHLLLAPLLFWWQPFQVGITPLLMMVIKVVALYVLGVSLVNRIAEQTEKLEELKRPVSLELAA